MSSSISDSSTRNRSASTEGSELPEHEHKRPRLSDTKADATHVMVELQQTNPHPAPSMPVTVSVANANNGDERSQVPIQTPPLPPRSSIPPAVISPTSKVTINTRPLSSQSVTQPTTEMDEPDMPSNSLTSEGLTVCGDGSNRTSVMRPDSTEHPETISIPSSPSKSPEIEVAEVEDYDQDPAQTRWTGRIGGSAPSSALKSIQPGHVYRTFPFASETTPGNTHRMVARMSERFQHAGAQDGEIFRQVKNWMADFVSLCDEFPARLIDEDREFWLRLPDLVEGLLRRDTGPPAQARIEDLVDFFVAYGQIAKLLADYDVRVLQTLSADTDSRRLKGVGLMCESYLQPLSWLLQHKIPFYEALRRHANFGISQFIALVIDRLGDHSTVGLLPSLSTLLSEICAVLPKRPDYYRYFNVVLMATLHLMGPMACIVTGEPGVHYEEISNLDQIRETAAEIALKADNAVQQAIVKQAPWLNLETAPKVIEQLGPLMHVIGVEVPQIGQDIVSTAGVGFVDSDYTDLKYTMSHAWKFKTFRKFITNGRMELRVYGVELMSTELITVYNEHIKGKTAAMTNPLVRFLVKFIKENQLVDYIVGVDSHPQLIRRSHNVVGFLCVSGTYTDADTDLIWGTIAESQDPRTVHEVFNLLQMCFNVYDPHALSYICQKLLEYPFDRFDLHVLQFTGNLLDHMRHQVGLLGPQPGPITDSITRTLCIRLLREASMEEYMSLEQAAAIRREFSHQMKNVFSLGRADAALLTINDDEKNQILREAAANLKSHSNQSTGDLQVLDCLFSMLRPDTIQETLQKFDLTALLVADFAHLRDRYDSTIANNGSLSSFEVLYDIRAKFLQYLILFAPDSFTDELLDLLWTSFITAKRLSLSIREKAWETLHNAVRMKPARDDNSFLDSIINKYLQCLGPQDYCEKLLDFIKMSVLYTIRRSPQHLLDSDDVVDIPGIDRIWKVMLEAPPNTIENEATDYIIQQYLDHNLITRRSKAVIDATHSSLIDRCVQQVISSASRLKSYTDGTVSGEDEPMVIIASEDEIRAEELRFDRSLLFLRRFLEGMKLRPRYSPAPGEQAPGLPEFTNKKGEPMELSIQICASKYVTPEMQKVVVGSENTEDELWKYLSDTSGFAQFTVFHFGRPIALADQHKPLGESRVSKGLILVNRIANSPENVPARSIRASSPVDSKIMHHFDDLYGLLDADQRLSREIYSFLSLFSAQTEVVRIIRSKEKSPEDLLPPDKPFKLLYCARALRSCIEYESFSSSPDTQFLIYSVQTIVTILPKLELGNSNDAFQMSIVHGLVEALLLAFRAKVPAEISREYIQNHPEFAVQASKLLRFSLVSNHVNMDELSTSVMVKLILEAFIEGCLHDDRIWDQVDSEIGLEELIMAAFIDDPRAEVRHALLEVVVGLTGAAGTKLHLKINDPRAPRSRFPPAAIEACLSHLWTVLAELLPRACGQADRCPEFCETMLAILRRIGKSFPLETLHQYLDQWTSLLLKHEHFEIVGQPLRDHVVACLTKLLLECCKLSKAANSLPPSNHIIDEIISQFLFPPLSDNGFVTAGTVKLPVLDGVVRNNLYSLVLVLCQGPQDLATIVKKLDDDLLPKDFFEPMFGHDRQSLRTDVGYAGLRNLSNTCYLNSLFAQLFMNVQFREFFLNNPSLDDSNQKLVLELAKVFAHMQNSYEKSVDPSGAVEAITTYEGEQIDVSVQMDVDEFFNLLFDRLEGQIDHRTRGLFKSIYGGQLVQQVKSKECEHISERLEPFSAVQVEIKGKARLEDSLRAYVEGEVLQGENKYSCTSCGRHVDAVKRACLKDVPDNLIFNLKRFDYDIMTGMRAKVNDEFQFPDTLDIAPYTLTRLSNEGQAGEPDYFQLTGVIVHSGTADSGHYYSFIRQRPSVKAPQDSWVQFNDQDVGVFDPGQMRDNCFGGNSEAGFYHIPKFYSAYMLFYQRTSSIRKVEQQYRQHDAINPVRIPLPYRMEQYIAQQNELFLRSYCAQDSSHALFVRQLLERMGSGVEKCSEDHILESSMIEMVLEYVRQISSRWKDLPSVEDTIRVLVHYAERCPNCAKTIAQWFTSTRVLEDVIVRSPYQAVRKCFGNLFWIVFHQLHSLKLAMGENEDDYVDLATSYARWLSSALAQLAKLWDVVTKSGRCWADYFSILNNIQSLGDEEVTLVLDEEFLEKCIDVVMMHLNNPTDFPISRKLKQRYAIYLTAREKNRPFNHGVLIRFLVNLLMRVDLHHMPEGDYRLSDKKVGLTPSELDALGLARMPPNLEWIRRLIAGRQNGAAIDALVEYLAGDRRLAGSLAEILLKGLNDRIINIAVSFLRPVIIFSENCQSEHQILDLVQAALESISTVGVDYGREYFEFVDVLVKLDNRFIDAESGFLLEQILHTVPNWAPTFLLAPSDGQSNIRHAAVDLLRRILFNPLQEVESQDPQTYTTYRNICQELASNAQNFAQSTFLTPRSRESTILQPGQISQLIDVVEHCLQFFDIENPLQEEKMNEVQNTMAALRAKAESVVETLSSADWQENSSEMAELSAEDYDDPPSS
ncbi:uncharacterized protein Z518_03729 [Rhinocladiella mackenziei CBS 650.93]|uniref:USP domain-containing protein n=1 Tax=Rhinocladiella mackenziei CBS 650.93 TaxID=1442369 RepID=A0A0D2FUH4_9EURO|nr:uncharacterized protein Z518_03729 [Rhinocladiella mackenziei CBS 650.93]KIX05757.1 hypothetical protein Z518_03729 [Rhinocladiella mackenziei CBS 650.93]